MPFGFVATPLALGGGCDAAELPTRVAEAVFDRDEVVAAAALPVLAVAATTFALGWVPHAERWRLGAVVAPQGLGRLFQLPLVGSGGLTCGNPEEGASLCSLWPQAVVGSRFWLLIAWRCATSPGSGQPVATIAVRKGEPPYKCCNKALELKTATS